MNLRRGVIRFVAASAVTGVIGLSALMPVDGEVIDPYRPPQCIWCPGNRGITLDASPGEVVRAVRSGYVSFVGRVVGTGYVVVDIGGGLRVTYGGLTPELLKMGDPVARGAVIGVAQGPLHLGVRLYDAYVDPAILWQPRTVRARLIPG
jgi:murein DD-endopeptidase MepM/ murein hydrolase activator NlpD